jgi:hypothetical protein
MGNIFRTVFADESVDLPIGVGRVGKYSMTSHTASSKSASSKSETATSTNKRGREDDNDYADEDFTSFPSAQSFQTPPQDLSTSSASVVFPSNAQEFKQCMSCYEDNLQHSKFCCSCGDAMST